MKIQQSGGAHGDEELILETIDKWVRTKVAATALKLEHADEYPRELVEDMKQLGLFGALVDPEYGGLGLSARTYAKIVTRISKEWMSLTGIFNSHLIMCLIIQRFGTQEQKDYWLPRLVGGELRGCLALTEPDAGSDLQAIRTSAKRLGDKYVVNGTKTWISNSIEGHAAAVLVRTDPDAVPRYRGLSMLLATKVDPDSKVPRPGVRNGKRFEKLGYKGIDSGEFIFEDYECDARLCLIGGEEGKGFVMAAGGLEIGRINVAARAVGIAQRALEESVKYAQVRRTMGKPIAQHQAIQLKLGDIGARTRASELLVEDAARLFDLGKRVDMEAGMAKYFASETAMAAAAEGMRIHGAYGYSKELVLERLYRDAPLLCIGEGTNEIQCIIIAKQLVERNPA
jgi:alkylation response protein AidB-like acyl-CoA dehydrogenase